MQQPVDLEINLDPRRATILGAAFDTFCRYGFRRSSMDDIARAAGLSRAALYLHFANKQDIYRSLIQQYFIVTETRAAAALRPGMPADAALAAFFAAKAGPELETMLASPHGQELLDANAATAADIVHSGEARIAAILADWLRAETVAGRIVLPDTAEDTANTLVAALAGLKSPGTGINGFRNGANRLARLAGRGLAAAPPVPDPA